MDHGMIMIPHKITKSGQWCWWWNGCISFSESGPLRSETSGLKSEQALCSGIWQWKRWIWFCKQLFWEKFLPHRSQRKCFLSPELPEWVTRCFWRLPRNVKHFPQTSQWNGFIPVCIISCFCIFPRRANGLLHTLQWKSFSPVWIILCFCKLPRRPNAFPQTSHENGRSPECSFRCFCMFPTKVKARPQMSHWKVFSGREDCAMAGLLLLLLPPWLLLLRPVLFKLEVAEDDGWQFFISSSSGSSLLLLLLLLPLLLQGDSVFGDEFRSWWLLVWWGWWLTLTWGKGFCCIWDWHFPEGNDFRHCSQCFSQGERGSDPLLKRLWENAFPQSPQWETLQWTLFWFIIWYPWPKTWFCETSKIVLSVAELLPIPRCLKLYIKNF